MSDLHEDVEHKKSATVVKKGRELANIKTLMEKRTEQRSSVIKNLAKDKFQYSLIVARQLTFTSQKIWKQFDDSYIEEFEQTYFVRTSKKKELTEYLLDCVLICRVHLVLEKKPEFVEVINKLQIPNFKPFDPQHIQSKEDILKYNQTKQLSCRVCAVLLSLVEMTKEQKMYAKTISLYQIYLKFVFEHYGIFEYATAKFKFANFYYEIKCFSEAVDEYADCLQIRSKNTFNEAYVDVLVNYSIALREIGRINEAIESTKTAIEVYNDLKKLENNQIDEYYLFLAKLQMEQAYFEQAYKNFLFVYKLRRELDRYHPKRIEVELNLLFFNQTLASASSSDSVYNISNKKQINERKQEAEKIYKILPEEILNREEFAKYCDDTNLRRAHLNLEIPEEFFDLLSSDQVVELDNLLQRLGGCSFQKGIIELTRTSLYEDVKIKNALRAANPHLKVIPNLKG